MGSYYPGTITGINYLSPNYGTRTEKINSIVLHCTEGSTFEGVRTWFKSTASKVSSHYVIDKNGDIYLIVPEHYTAIHAGNYYNQHSISIENVNSCYEPYTNVQYSSMNKLINYLTNPKAICK